MNLNLKNYHSYILAELNSRGLASLLFEAEGDEEEKDDSAEDGSDSLEDLSLDSDDESSDTEGAEPDSETDEAVDSDETEEENEEVKELIQDPDSLDNILTQKFIEFEEDAINSAKAKSSDVTTESIFRSKASKRISILYESEDRKPNIDVEHFANQIARFVKNYDSLIDMPQLIIKRAVNFLKTNYDNGTSEQFQESLRDMHDLELVKSPSPPGSKLGVPNAVGARQASA